MKYEDFLKLEITTTFFEMEKFIIGSQDGLHRQIRQIHLEAEAREGSLVKRKRDLARAKIEVRQVKAKIEKENDQLEKESLEIDLEEANEKVVNFNNAISRLEKEVNAIKLLINDMLSKVPEEEIKRLIDPENEYSIEKEYWVKRLAKQAMLDLASSGRISSGNLEAMLNLDEDDTIKAIVSALKDANTLNTSIVNLGKPGSEFKLPSNTSTDLEQLER
jgi:ACT domain-containing protein